MSNKANFDPCQKGKILCFFKRSFINIPVKIKYFFRSEGIFLFFTLIISLFTTFSYYNNTKEYPPGSIIRILLGTAPFPFHMRQLIYKCSYFLASLFNMNLYHVFFTLRVLSIILVIVVLRGILKELKIKYTFLPFLFPFATLFSFTNNYWYPTDFLEILFFALMILLILKNKSLLFTIVFGISFLNRESTIFILPFFIYYYFTQRKRKEMLFIGVLLITAILVIEFIFLPTETFPISKETYGWKLARNISFLKSFPLLLSDPQNEKAKDFFFKLITFSGFLYLLVIFYRKSIPKVLKHFLAIVSPLNIVSALMVGHISETRIFYPIIPGLILSSAFILKKQNKFIKLLNILIIVVVIIFIAKHGIFLKKDSEFSIKSKEFNLQEFKQWKKGSFMFQKKDIRVKKDRMVIDIERTQKTLLFLDSTVLVKCSEKRPLSCIIWLDKNLKYKSRFKKNGNNYHAFTRNPKFEMRNPSIQLKKIERIEINYEGEVSKRTYYEIRWVGFFIQNKN